MTSAPDDTTTDTSAIIAALRTERDAALSEKAALAEALAQRNSEFGERIEHQAATIDVLKAMSASPGDAQPVFDLIARQAANQCNVPTAAVAMLDGRMMHLATQSGFDAAYVAQFPRPVGLDFSMGRAVLNRRVDQVEDLTADPGHSFAPVLGPWSVIAVPILRDGQPMGAISIGRPAMGPFSASQVALLQTFAEQAVIAITSAETYRNLREALDRQTATAEVLGVINASPGNLEPVFDAILEKAMRLCEAPFGGLRRFDGEVFRAMVARDVTGAVANVLDEPIAPDPGSASERIVLGDDVVHIPDVVDTDAFRSGVPSRLRLVETLGARTVLWVALRKNDVLLGDLVLYRTEVRPFTDKQIALLQNFSAQAVVAMENARLLTEQQEALEQQTATAEVLQVINASPGNLAPVFDAILEKAARLCEAEMGTLWTYDGEYMQPAAMRGAPPSYAEFLKKGPHRPNWAQSRVLRGERVIHTVDVEGEGYRSGDQLTLAGADLGGIRTLLVVPLRKDEAALGTIGIYRQEVRPFTDKQIALLENFAAQAVIAMENARLLNEQGEALERQTATAEVLQVINASPGNLAPVFDAMLEKAMRLCGAAFGSFYTYDGEQFLSAAQRGLPEAFAEFRARTPLKPVPGSQLARAIENRQTLQVLDLKAEDLFLEGNPFVRAMAELGGVRTILVVPLCRDEVVLGFLSVYRQEVRAFSDKQIALLESFAAQAVIAMENARLINEQREALEQQTATADVLRVINGSPGNLVPVFNAILEWAHRVCDADGGVLYTYDGTHVRVAAVHGYPSDHAAGMLARAPYPPPNTLVQQMIATGRFIQVGDVEAARERLGASYAQDPAVSGMRTAAAIPLLKDGRLIGYITAWRRDVRLFSDKQIALLQNFAAQAVIAMENARLLDEIRQRQDELRITFENMGDGVAMFDETHHLVAWNRKFQDILDVPDDIIERRQTFSEYVRYLAERGEYAPGADPEEHVRQLIEQAGQARTYERTRPDGRVIEIRHNPVAGGGFVLIYADITERKHNEAEIRAARDAAEEASRTIEAAYRDLKTAQANLIQAEKMASLGQLTAGIAHEIKNPLNFVNNFSTLSTELIDELRGVLAPEPLGEIARTEVDDLTALLKGNLEKVVEHGQRADGIVKAMLDHSRGSSGERRMVNLNALIDEALNLAYHGARAQDQSFNITLERDFDEGIARIEVNPQDITRVFLNIFSNGFYATTRRAREARDAGFVPTLKVTTRDAGDAVEIRVRDNGTGIPADIRDKLFQPFFTTKPTGEGTGLGLSITYDIVTQQHGGSITVDSKVGEYSEFTIMLPRRP
jgi:GAF domain-containing protein/nitrogen-specific signal transduction histidine kinase